MSFFSKLFGGGKSDSKAPTPAEAIQRLRGVEEMLMKKQDFLERKVEQELATAKKNGTKNKRGKIETTLIFCVKTAVMKLSIDKYFPCY